MDQDILNLYSKLNSLNVSRETYLDFELFISMLIDKNISKSKYVSRETFKLSSFEYEFKISSSIKLYA